MRNDTNTVAPSTAQSAHPRVEVDPSMFDLNDWIVDDALDAGTAFPLGLEETPEETPLDTPDDHFGSAAVDAEILPPMPCFGAEFAPAPKNGPADSAPAFESPFDLAALFATQHAHQTADTAASSMSTTTVTIVEPSSTTKSTLPPLDLAPFTFATTPDLTSTPLPPTEFNIHPTATTPAAPTTPMVFAPNASTSTSTPHRLTKPLPTGVRRNITVDKLVPLDAPTQPRHYVTDSVTSRKVVPAAFRKKRGISEVEDPNDLEAIEEKRRKNTLAARKSRARKLETLQTLQDAVTRAEGERDYWMKRACEAEDMLRSLGHTTAGMMDTSYMQGMPPSAS